MPDHLTLEEKKELIGLIRDTIVYYVEGKKVPLRKTQNVGFNKEKGVFVSAYIDGALRGCIGNIEPRGSLYEQIQMRAIDAVSKDYRFKPVTKDELHGLTVSLSILTQPQKIESIDDILIEKHGVIVRGGNRVGIFLPQVATKMKWSKEEFLGELCSQKAGLPYDAWKDPKVELFIFEADEINEKELI